ncbi:MAG: DUF3800 domain-containing protein [Bryobacteraceae bacterium]
MWKAYFDESGSDAASRYFLLAGYISDIDHWISLSDEWEEALAGPPKLEYFKMTEAFQLRDQFAGWTERQRDNHIDRLRAIIQSHCLLGSGVAMPKDLYDRHVRGHIPKKYDNQYYASFVTSLDFLADMMNRLEQTGPIDFVFDQQNIEPRVRELFDEFKTSSHSYRTLVGEIDFRDDKNVLPLQAADMLAWRMRELLNDPLSRVSQFIPLDTSPPSGSLIIGEQALIRFVEDYRDRVAC